MKISRSPLPSLTGLRFIAAIQVVVFHLYASIPTLAGTPGSSFVGNGFVGVGLFFVLSGFVLGYNYLTPGDADIGGPRRFFAARFARIYVVYVLGVLIALPLFLLELRKAGGQGQAFEAVRVISLVLALLQAWVPDASCRLNCPGWSLSAEAAFYLLFPLLAIPLTRLSRRGWWFVMTACWFVSAAMAFVYTKLHPDGAVIGADTMGTWINVLRYNPLVRLPEFVVGMCLSLLFLTRNREDDAKAGRWAAPMLTVLVLALMFAAPLPYVLRHNVVFTPIFAALIFALASGGDALGRLLASRPLQSLGEASYALYILHVPLFVYFKKAAAVLGQDINHSVWLPIAYIVATQLVAIAVFHYVEEPTRRIIRRKLTTAIRV